MADPRKIRRRLDLEMVERDLCDSRARAQAIIMSGGVSVDGAVVTKPGTSVRPDSEIALVHTPMPYVSRGGIKLRHALDAFEVAVAGAVALDVGASTGGFTDVLLQAGAAKVYAVDVGYGQLAWSLRNDPRVIVLERTNIRTLDSLPEAPTVGVVDVSFISLRQVLPAMARLLDTRADVLALMKPQFEAGRRQVGRGGVVRDPGVWETVLHGVLDFATGSGWRVAGLDRSPIKGPAGNVEFVTHLTRGKKTHNLDLDAAIFEVVHRDAPTSRDGAAAADKREFDR